ncbi:protein indc11 [Jackrogersella minutella]|nr:protein indc11 [Jackrogersella minutella]
MTAIRKVLITEFGDVDVLRVVDDVCPPPPSGQIQIAVEYAGFNGADINMRKGIYPFQKKAPLTPGYCLVGTVHANGEGCSLFKPGDIVCVMTKYDAEAELVNQPEKYCVKVLDGVDNKQATPLVCDWATAYEMVTLTAKVSKGQRVFVHGISGAVGFAIMRLSRLRGAEVYGTASERNHDTIRAYGATPFVYTDKKWIEKMKGLGGAHVVFDPLGFESFDASYSILATKGPLVAYGNNKGNLNVLTSKRTTFYGISRDSSTYKSSLEALLDMAKDGTIKVPIRDVWDLEDIKTAHKQ